MFGKNKILLVAVVGLVLAVLLVVYGPFNSSPQNNLINTSGNSGGNDDTPEKENFLADSFNNVKNSWAFCGIDIEKQPIVSSFSSNELLQCDFEAIKNSLENYNSDLISKKNVPSSALDLLELNISIVNYLSMLKENQIATAPQKETMDSLKTTEEICANLPLYESYFSSLEEIKTKSSILAQEMGIFSAKHASLAQLIKLQEDIELLQGLDSKFEEKRLFLESWKEGCGVSE